MKRGMYIKARIFFVSPIIFLSLLVVYYAFRQQKARWRGKIEVENGVKVITNPNKPLYGEIEFELEEDLGIGNKEDENYSFSRVRGVVVDEEENIYVSDADKRRIQKFDSHGKYLQTIGKTALERPMKILLDEKAGFLYVLDRHIKVFNKEGTYLTHIPIRPSDFLLSQDGNIFVVSYSGPFVFLRKVNSQGHILMELAKSPFKLIVMGFFEGMLPGDERSGIEYDLFAAQIDAHTFVYGYSREYELNVIDHKGKLILKIRKKESYREFSKTMKQSEISNKLPPHMPFFHSLFTDSEGLIYVQKNMPNIRENRECDVFSRDGYYLYKTSISRNFELIKKDYLYTFEPGQIKRYRIKNWQLIKRDIQNN